MDDSDDFSDDLKLSQILDDEDNVALEKLNYSKISSTQKPFSHNEEPTPEHMKILKKYFGHTSFKPLQWQIINSILKSKRDNCAIMSTGYGKSLCFQFPAMYTRGVTLVISPLISLMEDQVYSLKIARISACLLGTAQNDTPQVLNDIYANKYSIIYLTPEFATGESGAVILKRIHQTLNVCLIAVDEAHCVSSWGHDFRPQYRKLSLVRQHLPGVPILAVTATATKRVEDDIIKSLRLKNPQISHSGFDRPNLYLEVHQKSQQGPSADFMNVSREFPRPTIIYCLTRKNTDTLSELLKSKGLNCDSYHAGRSLRERKDVHEKFLKDQLDVIVATNAFGMGIDKPDIRCVIHHGAPSSIEAYYQEIGRAGRDGEPSRCVMFYSESDFQKHLMLSQMNTQKHSNEQNQVLSDSVRKYIHSTQCRRAHILKYFGENYTGTNNKCCDICHSKSSGIEHNYEGVDKDGLYDFTEDAEKMLNSINAIGGKYGLTIYILFLRGSRSNKLKDSYKSHRLHGCGKGKTENWWKCISNILVEQGYLLRKAVKFSGFASYTFELTTRGDDFLRKISKDKNSVQLKLKPQADILEQLKIKPKVTANSYVSVNQVETSSKAVLIKNKEEEFDKKLRDLIMERRFQIADERDCMPHHVISIPDIRELVRVKPRTLKQLESCKFEMFSEVKIHQFGQQLIDIILKELGPCEDEDSTTTSMAHALLKFPYIQSSSASTDISYNMFKKGLSIDEIAKERVMSTSTISGHLLDCIKKGYPIKMKQMGVDKSKVLVILRAILETPGSAVKPIKEKCPSDITWDDVKVVMAYYQTRNHLNENRIPFQDFEDYSFESLQSEAGSLDIQNLPENEQKNTIKPKTSISEEDRELEEFLKLGKAMIARETEQIELANDDKHDSTCSYQSTTGINASATSDNQNDPKTIKDTVNSKLDERNSTSLAEPDCETVNNKISDRKRAGFEISASDDDLFEEAFESPSSSPLPKKKLK